jgi:hypothetical protein
MPVDKDNNYNSNLGWYINSDLPSNEAHTLPCEDDELFGLEHLQEKERLLEEIEKAINYLKLQDSFDQTTQEESERSEGLSSPHEAFTSPLVHMEISSLKYWQVLEKNEQLERDLEEIIILRKQLKSFDQKTQ